MSVFFLKHRPQRVADLDLPEVVKSITMILESKDRPQSFLFAGPKGSGKTSAARLLARALNCEKKEGIEPCNKCDNCRELLRGASVDVVEMDAASNRGIDDVRVMKERAYLSPSKLKFKVFVIDEAH
ncbi:AAA family ATPase, partial [Patescibacteria group bacterium]|nr:AAA family ATPase [Patescibacteria group bacterium]